MEPLDKLEMILNGQIAKRQKEIERARCSMIKSSIDADMGDKPLSEFKITRTVETPDA